MPNKILIFGKGFAGGRLEEDLKCPVTTRRISSYADVQAEIDQYKPKTIINCIGFTGTNNVDGCEEHLDKTLYSNSYIPLLMAEVALRNKIKMVHISSGCIYHYDYKKQKPIDEEIIPDYYDLYYSRSKIYADSALRELAKRYNVLITRIRIPLDDRPHPKNILTKLVKYKSIIDVPNSVTYMPEFIRALKYLIQHEKTGLYNVAAKGPVVYSKLLDEYKKYKPDFDYTVIKLKDLKLTRTNLILSTKKLEKTGFKVSSADEVIKACIKNYVKY